MSTYSTCALYMKRDGAQSLLNPFTKKEYDDHCSSGNTTSICVTARKPLSHAADDVRKAIEKACLKDGRYVLDAPCVQALASAPEYPRHVRSPSDPLFREAELCRTRLNGDYKAMCGGHEVTYESLRAKIGADCDQCCATVVREYEEETAKRNPKTTRVSHSEERHGLARPSYVPFRV